MRDFLLEPITLKGGEEVRVDWTAYSKCRACGATIVWCKNKNLKKVPISKDKNGEWEFHYLACPRPI